MQKVRKLTSGKIQIIENGDICISMQCNISYRIVDRNEMVLEDTAGQRASLYADQVQYTQLDPAGSVSQSFANAQELADFLDANFFVG